MDPAPLLEAAIAARSRAEAAECNVGERPALDPDAEADALRIYDELVRSRAARMAVRRDSLRLLGIGNAVGVSACSLTVALVMGGAGPLSTPIDLTMTAAAAGPLTAIGTSVRRFTVARAEVRSQLARLGSALDAAGVSTLGELRARRLALEGWEERRLFAADALERADEAEAVWAAAARTNLLAELASALAILAAGGGAAQPAKDENAAAPAPVIPIAVPARFGELVHRVRGRGLRLWRAG